MNVDKLIEWISWLEKEELSHYKIEQCSKEKANAFYIELPKCIARTEGAIWSSSMMFSPVRAVFPIEEDENFNGEKIYLRIRFKKTFRERVKEKIRAVWEKNKRG